MLKTAAAMCVSASGGENIILWREKKRLKKKKRRNQFTSLHIGIYAGHGNYGFLNEKRVTTTSRYIYILY